MSAPLTSISTCIGGNSVEKTRRAKSLDARWFSRWVLVVALLSISTCAGCIAPAKRLVAPQREYVLYRQVRLSRELLPRLRAAQRYLQAYPHGLWADQVRPWFLRAELRYYLHNTRSIDGLSKYLHYLPSGPHADKAYGHLQDLRLHSRHAVGANLAKRASKTEARLAMLHHERDVAQDTFFSWLTRLLAIRTWHQRTSALSPDFILWWRMAHPQARCVDQVCTKSLMAPYSLPRGSDRDRRALVMDVQLTLKHDNVELATISGPALFTRLYEVYEKHPVSPDDASGRIASISFVIDMVRSAAKTAWSGRSPCSSVPTTSPTVLDLRCKGRSLRMVVASDQQTDDRIVVRDL